jgi:hypothetical protein
VKGEEGGGRREERRGENTCMVISEGESKTLYSSADASASGSSTYLHN